MLTAGVVAIRRKAISDIISQLSDQGISSRNLGLLLAAIGRIILDGSREASTWQWNREDGGRILNLTKVDEEGTEMLKFEERNTDAEPITAVVASGQALRKRPNA